MSSAIVAYYSLFGSTQRLAGEISRITGGKLARIVPEREYSFDYNTACKEIRNEMQRGFCPKLISGNESIAAYDTVFIGSPNWFKTFAPPVLAFLRNHDFKGKRIVPFCTHGGGGLCEMAEQIRKECPTAVVLPGIACGGSFTAEDVERGILASGFGEK